MRDFIKNNLNLSSEELETFLLCIHENKIAAKTIFFNEGELFNKLLFIQSGIIRSFRLIDGEDYSFYFYTNNEFVVDLESFLTDTTSQLNFEALTDCTFTEIKKPALLSLYKKIPGLEKLGRIIAEQAYLNVHERLKQFQTDDLETRYLKLISRNPDLFQTVSQYHIASYLGVKPQSLSRIRAKLANRKS
jgi:CRP-like cAMP-binding protein